MPPAAFRSCWRRCYHLAAGDQSRSPARGRSWPTWACCTPSLSRRGGC
uniref:Uncharacterized protein n=1 Tax=Arundo donax TaxID=35708 RepID=A0A0A9FGJ1_ARUDO